MLFEEKFCPSRPPRFGRSMAFPHVPVASATQDLLHVTGGRYVHSWWLGEGTWVEMFFVMLMWLGGRILQVKGSVERFRRYQKYIWVFPKVGVPQNGWFIMKTLSKWMIWVYHYLRKHPYIHQIKPIFLYFKLPVFGVKSSKRSGVVKDFELPEFDLLLWDSLLSAWESHDQSGPDSRLS